MACDISAPGDIENRNEFTLLSMYDLNKLEARKLLEQALAVTNDFIPALLSLRVISVYFPSILNGYELPISPSTGTFCSLFDG